MLAAWPIHTVETSGLIYSIVSYIDNPDVTTPPGEFIYMDISFFGFSASRNSNCAQTREAKLSSTGPTRKIILSLRSLE